MSPMPSQVYVQNFCFYPWSSPAWNTGFQTDCLSFFSSSSYTSFTANIHETSQHSPESNCTVLYCCVLHVLYCIYFPSNYLGKCDIILKTVCWACPARLITHTNFPISPRSSELLVSTFATAVGQYTKGISLLR